MNIHYITHLPILTTLCAGWVVSVPTHQIREDVFHISDFQKGHTLWESFIPQTGSVINGLFTTLTSRLSEAFSALWCKTHSEAQGHPYQRAGLESDMKNDMLGWTFCCLDSLWCQEMEKTRLLVCVSHLSYTQCHRQPLHYALPSRFIIPESIESSAGGDF